MIAEGVCASVETSYANGGWPEAGPLAVAFRTPRMVGVLIRLHRPVLARHYNVRSSAGSRGLDRD
jgi:hypothetical protein